MGPRRGPFNRGCLKVAEGWLWRGLSSHPSNCLQPGGVKKKNASVITALGWELIVSLQLSCSAVLEKGGNERLCSLGRFCSTKHHLLQTPARSESLQGACSARCLFSPPPIVSLRCSPASVFSFSSHLEYSKLTLRCQVKPENGKKGWSMFFDSRRWSRLAFSLKVKVRRLPCRTSDNSK